MWIKRWLSQKYILFKIEKVQSFANLEDPFLFQMRWLRKTNLRFYRIKLQTYEPSNNCVEEEKYFLCNKKGVTDYILEDTLPFQMKGYFYDFIILSFLN